MCFGHFRVFTDIAENRIVTSERLKTYCDVIASGPYHCCLCCERLEHRSCLLLSYCVDLIKFIVISQQIMLRWTIIPTIAFSEGIISAVQTAFQNTKD